ncbi:hypothetical protein [Alistipes putredinis]|uniref:hypothetical protein n=1 Tax=Alistipes putredinis TaxID=28117 RepID=UPI003AB23E24
MKTLEELLQECGCKGNAFDDKGELTDEGSEAYGRLVNFLYDIETLTGLSVEPIISQLDAITDEKYY